MRTHHNIKRSYSKMHLLTVLILSILFGEMGYAQTLESKAYPAGNYIFCGKELPKAFSYIIEKQENNSQWKPVAQLKAPVNLAECRARIMALPVVVASVTQIQPAVTEFVWNRINKPNSTLDSLYAYCYDPRYQFVAGVGWFDDGIKQPGTYKYRVSMLNKAGVKTLKTEVSVVFPAKPLQAKAIPLRFKLNPSSVSLSYDVGNDKIVTGLKLFRSLYLQKDFKETSPYLMFTTEKEKMVASLTDNNVINGLTYSYVAVPYDGLGNIGAASDTVNVYYVAKPVDIGMITEFTAEPVPERTGNLLKWKYRQGAYVNTVEVYRSTTYDGNYVKLASLGPKETEYFDAALIQPATTYFYYLMINSGVGNSLPSARIPVILEGKKANVIPPQDLTLTKKGNVVTLKFRKVGMDVRGYYVYRADGYRAPLSQLPRMLLSTDSLLNYNDTLPVSVRSSVYSYAVASINTSYNISPMSSRVNTVFSGGQLPVPADLNGIVQNNQVMLVWSDAASNNAAITGYEIYRKTIFNDKEETPEKLIASTNFSKNNFEDKSILPGRDYTYRVRCITADASDASSFSLPYSVFIPTESIMPPGQVSVISSTGKILLRWTLPMTENIQSVQIYRAVENQKETLLKSLDAKAESYEDTTAKKGTMYYYFITIKYKNGLESKPTDALSAKLSQ